MEMNLTSIHEEESSIPGLGTEVPHQVATCHSQKKKKSARRVPILSQWSRILTSIPENSGLISGLNQWVKDLALLWRRPAATAPI